ncbi:mechanosensitive ion channel family protein [Erythrobacteraceae bacterium CFH 75059]|nr:mechanosensitive ion channel family protein [Erythrobacteraceae bacterium CFH 75059]
MDYVATLQAQLHAMALGFVAQLPNLAFALIAILVTWIAARFAVRIADLLVARTDLRPSLKELLDTLVRVAIWTAGLLFAAMLVMPGLTPASLLAGLGIGAVAIGFAFQDIFENFLAGVLIMARRKMQIGDLVECEGITGRVEHITLRETHVRALSNELTIVPNAVLFKNPVRIVTDEERRRYELVVGVSYDADLDRTAEVLRRAVEKVASVDQARGVEIYATTFGPSAIDFLVRWWAGSTPRAGFESRDRVVRAVRRALADARIEIPYPQMTHSFREPVQVQVRTGEKD